MTQSPSTPPHPDPARYVARALTPEAFAPYGDVLRPGLGETKDIRGGTVRLSKSPAVFEHLPAAPDAKLDFYDVQPLHGPLVASTIERHPRSTQLFCPMGRARWLVAVWPDGPGGAAEAFVAGPGDVVTYRPNIWHHGIVALEQPVCFASLMWKSGDGTGDTEFQQLPRPVAIDWPRS